MANQTCPVCMMTVTGATAPSAMYEGQRYAFCGPACQRAFLKQPAKYAARLAAR